MYHATTTQEPELTPPPTERAVILQPLSQPAGYVSRKARRAHAKRLSRTKRSAR